MANIKSIKYLTQEELKRLLGVIESKRDRAIFRVVYHHGLRAGEVGMIKLEDVDLDRGRITIVREKHSMGGEYAMHPTEIKAIKAWLKERKDGILWLFPSQRGTPITRFTLDKLMKRYGAKADIPADKRQFSFVTYSLRRHIEDTSKNLVLADISA